LGALVMLYVTVCLEAIGYVPFGIFSRLNVIGGKGVV
jgi:hypothetical protein